MEVHPGASRSVLPIQLLMGAERLYVRHQILDARSGSRMRKLVLLQFL
jgi:hypothetical protein